MVDRIVLVQIVALAGEENEIDALVQKAFDVPVRKLGGIADGVAGDGVLPPEIQAAGGLLAQNDFEAARLEKARPQRELFVIAERERNPPCPAFLWRRSRFLRYVRTYSGTYPARPNGV